jgi:DsbC/DsbD-like thiol-disulfide interchange protein
MPLSLFLISIVPLVAASSQSPGSDQKIDTPHLTIVTSTTPSKAGSASLVVDVAPKPKMHVYAPDKTQTYIPVSLTLAAGDGVKPGAPKFPAPEKYFFEALKETQLVYSKPFRIVQDVTLTGASARTIKGTLRYQACDDKVCYPPRNVPVEWMVK